MDQINGKIIWVIGASSGIGHALASALDKAGASLILSARRAKQLNELNQSLGNKHQTIALDVGTPSQLEAGVKTIKAQNGGRLDSVIFLPALYATDPKTNQSLDFMLQALQVNIGGAFATVQYCLPLFKAQGHGQIVICGSVAGYRGLPHGQPYCATKAALINYTESLKIELETDNIDVKLISPGFVETPLTDKNDFPMPMMISASRAADEIMRGLTSKAFEIHFPKRFTYILKLIQLLPNRLYFTLARKMRRH